MPRLQRDLQPFELKAKQGFGRLEALDEPPKGLRCKIANLHLSECVVWSALPPALLLPPGPANCEAFGRQATAAQSDIRKLPVAEAPQVGKSNLDVARMSGHLATRPVVPHNTSNASDHP